MLYIALGRNVGDSPMSDYEWESFRKYVCSAIEAEEIVNKPDTVAFGESNFEGMAEETCVLVWFGIQEQLSLPAIAKLKAIATVFGQESIAWSVSVTNFAKGELGE